MSFPTELIVVDVGNSRAKWGRIVGDQLVEVSIQSLDAPAEWEKQLRAWQPAQSCRWTIAGSNPPMMDRLIGWLAQEHQTVRIIDQQSQLPLVIDVEVPEQVGRDRLFNALAVEHHPAIIISAGSAVTVDALSPEGHFLGGSIMPGLHMMAAALHQYTASLPEIKVRWPAPPMPGKNTITAMQIGITQAALGGISNCCHQLLKQLGDHTPIYLTGGDGELLRDHLPFSTIYAPQLTLQGILIATRALWP